MTPESDEPPPPFVIDAAQGLVAVPGRRLLFSRSRFTHTGQFALSPSSPQLGPGLLIYVHGYNEAQDTAKGYGENNIAAGYREGGGKCDVATFLWNSRFGALQFRESIQSANATAPVFAEAVNALRAARPGLRIHVLAHSLGARVVLQAIETREVKLQDVVLVAPAISRRALEPGREFGGVPGRVGRLLFTRNRADRVLRWYRLFWGRALGRSGLRPTASPLPNVVEEDFQSAWNSHPNDGGHGAILHPQYWKSFWQRILARGLFQ
jgi:pimeloyl-ACP methyl ester carboxylesterase